MLHRAILFSFLGFLYQSAQAQIQIMPKGVQSVKQITTDYTGKDPFIIMEQEIFFNDSAITVQQKRTSFDYINGEHIKTSFYQYDYNPNTRKGEFSTTRFPTPKNKLESPAKSYTKFTSYNHKDMNTFTQSYDENGQLIVETQEDYNAQGLRTSKRHNDIKFNTIHYDELTRNNAGKITRWLSKDTENGRESIARDIKTTYLSDTLLLNEKGYNYSNWSEINNKYKKGELISQTVERGYIQSTGKVLIDAKTVTKYANNKPISSTYTENGKKIATTTYAFTDSTETEIVTEKRNKVTTTTKTVTKRIFDEKRNLIHLHKLVNDKTTFEMKRFFEEGVLQKVESWEYKITGEEWHTVTTYNAQGNPINRKEHKNKVLTKEDAYTYQLYEVN